jgi:hypothetical protein
MVNRESLPLIFALMIPFLLILVILLYIYGYDITLFLRQIHWVYYVIILPIILSFTVAIIKYMRPD